MESNKLIPLSLFMILALSGLGFSAQRVVLAEELYQED